jgi:hypothetical protein
MTRNLIRYRTHAEHADENQRLIEAVFDDLSATRPAGIRYGVLRLEETVFQHIVLADDDAARARLTGLAAFRAFQERVRERCLEPPATKPFVLVGGYRIFDAP